jgi:hypothetical protein
VLTGQAPAVLVRRSFPDLLPQDRAPGRHLSDVTRSICMGLGDFDEDADPPYNLMRLGLTMERGLGHQLAHHYPGRYLRTWNPIYQCWDMGMQIEKDGIWMNLDLLNVYGVPAWEPQPRVPVAWAVEDAKMTRKSSRHSHDQTNQTGAVTWAPKWREAWMRLAGYCWAVGARIGRLWVAHLFDYSGSWGGDVEACVWERKWDTPEGEDELRINWEMIVRHERGMPPVEVR